MAGPQDAGGAPPESVLLQQYAGLKNTVSSERLAPGELEVGLNIDIDDAGQPRRRRGQTLVSAGDWHSIFNAQSGKVFGVHDGQLVRIFPNYTTQTLGMFCGEVGLSWTEAGTTIYFASEFVSGKIASDDSIAPWGAITSEGLWLSPIVNPTKTLNPIKGRLLGKPPLASSICYSNGRIWLADENTLWATEVYMYDYVDKTRSFLQFESNITCLGNVTDGLYVGTETGVYFLGGPLKEMKRTQVCIGGALRNSMVSIPPDGLPHQRPISNAAILVMTELGLAVGYDAANFALMTDDTFWFPKADSVAAMVRRQDGFTQYVGVADSGGTPIAEARIGDYVDAEIRRYTGA